MLAVSLAALAGLAAVPLAAAKDGDVRVSGRCTKASTVKLKLSEEDGRIEVEFEVDQNVVGDTWKVQLLRNGERFFQGRATTVAPSGSFEVRRVISDPAGADTVRAIAKNPATGEVCRGTATSDF